MDMIGGKSSYEMGASFFDGKGQPGTDRIRSAMAVCRRASATKT
jgi:hypothetical protein